MAECSYARCLQERRLIKRELMKWSKNMVYIVGLERVAEELMGRRKWKLYQEVLARSQLTANSTNPAQNENTNQSTKIVPLQQHPKKEDLASIKQASVENHLKERSTPTITTTTTIKSEVNENLEDKGCVLTSVKEEKLETDSRGNSTSITPESSSERPVTPIDWKPDEKCYFCVDGKLLTVNEKGDLVAESGPALSEAELANRQTSIDSESDSRDSSPELELDSQRAAAAAATHANKTVTSRLRDPQPPNMTSLESMTAHLAAIASIQGLQSGLGPFCPSLWYHQLTQQVTSAPAPTSETSAAPISPSIKDSPSPSDTTGEQPLDLSAKPSPNSSIASGDPKQVFRAKPRMSAVTGRRTYTEEELHSALQDIMSGKLGTRRAAVIYGIPRSTLRNKVYKIAMEQKREAHTLHPPTLEELVDADDEDKELSGDEDKDEKLLVPEDLARFTTSQLAAAALQKITSGCDNSQTDIKPSTSLDPQTITKIPSSTTTTPTPQTPPITPNPWLDPNVLLQSLLLTGSLGALPGIIQPQIDDPVAFRELFSKLIIQQEEMLKEQMKTSAANDILNNGKPNLLDPRLLMQTLPLLQQQQQQHQHQQQQQSQHQQQHQQHHSQQQQHQHQQQQHQHSPYLYQNRLPKSETPETNSSVDIVENSDDPSVILKIPSYKPVAGSSSSSGKNGEHLIGSPVPTTTTPILSRSPQQPNNLPGISPPLIRQSSESQSPPIFSLRDVIANSISRTFNQQAAKEATVPKSSLQTSDNIEQQKRASISVIKNLGGTDISRFATTPNILSNNANNAAAAAAAAAAQNAANAAAGGIGGKGTRPKRGKYRNYDRDSLVEAVKAVQRGEMSVHRAGSYYGVPHSTLEYKVKERHLMRPRKREPKPQPLDDRTGSSSSSSVTSKNPSIPGISAVSSLDKVKSSLVGVQKSSGLKSNPPFPSTSPNGMKVPIFDPAMAAQLQYTQPFFWPHTAGSFSALPMDFARTTGSSTTGPPAFPSNTEGFLASQMIQRFHEETNRLGGGGGVVGGGGSNTNTNTSASTVAANVNKFNSNNSNHPPPPSLPSGTTATAASIKSAREIAESLYDNGGANGSFLDGIIRRSLDRKPIDFPRGALIDQLVKNTRNLGSNNSDPQQQHHQQQLTNQQHTQKTKRPANSPVNFPVIDIKRERISPTTSISYDTEHSSIEPPDISSSKESLESLVKIRDGRSIKIEDPQQQQQQQQQSQSQSQQQQLQSLHQVHHPSTIATLHRQQQQQQQQHLHHHPVTGPTTIRPLQMEIDLNGGNSSSAGNTITATSSLVGQIKSEKEDIL